MDEATRQRTQTVTIVVMFISFLFALFFVGVELAEKNRTIEYLKRDCAKQESK